MPATPDHHAPTRMIGETAPAFSLQDQNGRTHRLADYRGQHVVLFFYPKDSTEGCTREACGFRDLSAEFAAHGAAILGISILDTKSKAAFARKHALAYPLLADEQQTAAQAYGVWVEKSMYGKKYMGISRETFIIDPEGRIVAHWPKAAGSEAHATEVLAKLKELQGR